MKGKVIIVGAGEVGKSIISSLSAENFDVTLIEQSEEQVNEVADQTDILVIKGDATNMQILKDAGIEKVDAILAVTNDDKTNLMIAEIALNTKVKKIVSLVNIPGNEELFTKLGVVTLVPKVALQVTAIKNALLKSEEHPRRVIADLGKGDVEIVELKVGPKSTLIGKEPVIPNGVISVIYRNADLIIPEGSEKIQEGDILVISTKVDNLNAIMKLVEQ